jgi:heme-degrading monooxygenase HmoA
MKQFFYGITLTGMWLMLSAFTLGMPFNASDALEQIPDGAPVFVAVTHVTLGDNDNKNDIFWEHTYAVIDSLPTHQGYLGYKVRKQIFGNEAWTMTVWSDEDALNGFVRGDTHGEAIQNGLDAVAKARFVRFSIERSKIPLSWDDVEKIMNEKGRDLYGKQ